MAQEPEDRTKQMPEDSVSGHPRFDLDMRSPKLRRVRDYWLEIKGDAAIPRQADFVLTDLADVIPHLIIIDVIHDPVRLKFRLLGTFVTDVVGRNSTGQWLDETLFPDNLEEIIWAYRHCAQTGLPLATEGPVDIAEKAWTGSEVLMLPLTDNGSSVTQLASCYDLMDRREQHPEMSGEIIINWEK